MVDSQRAVEDVDHAVTSWVATETKAELVILLALVVVELNLFELHVYLSFLYEYRNATDIQTSFQR